MSAFEIFTGVLLVIYIGFSLTLAGLLGWAMTERMD